MQLPVLCLLLAGPPVPNAGHKVACSNLIRGKDFLNCESGTPTTLLHIGIRACSISAGSKCYATHITTMSQTVGTDMGTDTFFIATQTAGPTWGPTFISRNAIIEIVCIALVCIGK